MEKFISIIQRNVDWWLESGIPLKYRLTYNFQQLLAYIRLALFKKKQISYLGHMINFDNPAAPLTLQTYPKEILQRILANTKDEIESVLDIGGNIGQFSLTLAILGNVKFIDVFEPNKEVFEILKKNVKGVNEISIYNSGIGDPAVKTMFFRQDRSGTGSLLKENADKGKTDNLESISINVVDDVSTITDKNHYDLVKIDVEGYEYNLIKSIKKLKTRYLYIEISAEGRKKNFSTSDMYSLIKEKFGEYNIVFQTEFCRKSELYEVLFEFPGS